MENEQVYNNENLRSDRKTSKLTKFIIVILLVAASYCSLKFFINFKSFADKNNEISSKNKNAVVESVVPVISYSCISNCKYSSKIIYNPYWKKNFTVRITVTDSRGVKKIDLQKSDIKLGSNLSLEGINFVKNKSSANKLVYDIKLKNNISVIKKEFKTYIKIKEGIFVNTKSKASNETTIPIYIEIYEN